MIFISKDRYGYRTRMHAPPPVVYLDHGIMRQIADSEVWRRRLTGSLRRRGTLALSTVHCLEIVNQDPGASAARLRRLLDGVGTSFCLLTTSIDAVADRVRAEGISEAEAALDLETAEELAQLVGYPATLVAGTFATWSMQDAPRVRALMWSSRDRLYELFLAVQARHRETKRYPTFDRPESVVHYIRTRLTIELLRQGGPFEANDVIDIQHAAVPLAVCEFVLLDGRWTDLAGRVRQPPRRARVFSGKKGQIDAFLDALEAWTPAPEVK